MENTFALNTIIVDDNLSLAVELEMMLEEINCKVIKKIDNAEDVLKLVSKVKVDFILMDIQLNGELNGIEVGEKIKHLDIPIIYITSFEKKKYYEQAKRPNTFGFLIKPIKKFTLFACVDQVLRSIEKTKLSLLPSSIDSKNTFFIKNNIVFIKKGIYQKIPLSSIYFFKSNDNYCEIILESTKVLIRTPISEIEDLLSAKNFIRIHRQYIVNLKKIESINSSNNNILINKTTLPISRTRKKKILILINERL